MCVTIIIQEKEAINLSVCDHGKGSRDGIYGGWKRKGREKCNFILIEYTMYYIYIHTQYTHILKIGMVTFTCNSSASESGIKDP